MFFRENIGVGVEFSVITRKKVNFTYSVV